MEIKHKTTPKQMQLIDAMKITGNLKELQAMLKWNGRELHNMIGYLNQRNFVNRLSKSNYELNYDYLYNDKKDKYKPINIDGKIIDVNKIPEEVREYIWQNRHKTCSELRIITKLPRFYIRQYIYERKIREFPRLREY